MAKVLQHHYEKCAICHKRIDKNNSGKFYCQGHSFYEIVLRLQQARRVQLNLFKKEVK